MRKLIHSTTISPFGAPASVTVPLVTALMLLAGNATADEAISPYVTADEIKITSTRAPSVSFVGDRFNPYVLNSDIKVSGRQQGEVPLITFDRFNPYVVE